MAETQGFRRIGDDIEGLNIPVNVNFCSQNVNIIYISMFQGTFQLFEKCLFLV